jgi:hypothetical protein
MKSKRRLYARIFLVVTLVGTYLYGDEPHGWLRALALGATGVVIWEALDILFGSP